MWECEYGREQMDLKLLFLRFLSNLWIPVAAAIAGGILGGAGYFLMEVVLAPAPAYQSVAEYYIDYQLNEEGVEYTYFNATTWESLIKTDVFTEAMLAELTDTDITKEQLQRYVSATLLSDTRIVTCTVVTENPEITKRVSEASKEAFIQFGKSQKEAREIRVLTSPTEPKRILVDNRTGRAAVLWAAAGLLAGLFGMFLYHLLDDSIYVPAVFERRYHIPVAGVWWEDGSTPAPSLREIHTNIEYLASTNKDIAFTAVEEMEKPEAFLQKWPNALWMDSFIEGSRAFAEESFVELRKAQGIVLFLKGANHNGKKIEKALDTLRKQECKVTAVIITDVPKKLLRAYERTKLI